MILLLNVKNIVKTEKGRFFVTHHCLVQNGTGNLFSIVASRLFRS